jgi:amino-acid N-acetyltransferase
VIREGREDDGEALRALLAAAGLPVEGVVTHLASFFVADDGGEIVAGAGLEVHGRWGLLRSVVVAPAARSRGLGQALTERVLREAERRELAGVYLLTTTAEAYFAALGFAVVSRNEVPDALRASSELQGLCPASAIVMRRALPNHARE